MGAFSRQLEQSKTLHWAISTLEKRIICGKHSPRIWEIISLMGSISETGAHAHISVSGKDFVGHSGHLKEAEVTITVELFLTELKKIRRKEDLETGLKLMEL